MQKESINVAAHELRIPIQPIRGLTGLLKSRIRDKEQYEIINIVIRNAKRLQRLTQNILDITKIESQSLEPKREQFNLNDIISNALQDYRSQIERNSNKRNLEILYEPTEDNLFVEADKEG